MRWRGFTLVEVLGAVALMGLLVVAVLTATSSIFRSQQALAVQGQGEQLTSWQRPMLDLVRRDLQHAGDVQAPGRGVVARISGLGALDPATLQPQHQPVTVRYLLVDDQGQLVDHIDERDPQPLWLVREQTWAASTEFALTGTANTPWREILCGQVKNAKLLIIESAEQDDRSRTNDRATKPTAPGRYRLTVEWIDENQPTLQRILQVK